MPKSTSKHIPSIIDNAKDVADIIQQVAEFIPVPGVELAAGIVQRILTISQKIMANK